MNNKFQVGQWVFYNYELCQIEKMEGDVVTCVTTGQFQTSGQRLDCFPITMQVKQASDSVEYYSKEFHKSTANLNHPDLHRKLVELWENICNAEGEKAIQKAYSELQSFGDAVMVKIRDMRGEYVGGVSLFRH